MKRPVIALAAVCLAMSPALAETYRLIHAIGNNERTIARELSKAECERQKRDRRTVNAVLGVGGSLTCLPESLFED